MSARNRFAGWLVSGAMVGSASEPWDNGFHPARVAGVGIRFELVGFRSGRADLLGLSGTGPMEQLEIGLLVGPADYFENREFDPASGWITWLVRAEGKFHHRKVIRSLAKHLAV